MTHTEQQIIRQAGAFIADALGFTVDTSDRYADHWGVFIDGPDGARLFVSRAAWNKPDRLEISGIYPTDPGTRTPYGTGRQAITVARDRDPAAVAKDVRRRLLPDYLTELAKVTAGQAEDVKAADARRALATTLGAGHVETEPKDSQARISLQCEGVSYGSAVISYRADSVALDLHGVSPENAARILAILSA